MATLEEDLNIRHSTSNYLWFVHEFVTFFFAHSVIRCAQNQLPARTVSALSAVTSILDDYISDRDLRLSEMHVLEGESLHADEKNGQQHVCPSHSTGF